MKVTTSLKSITEGRTWKYFYRSLCHSRVRGKNLEVELKKMLKVDDEKSVNCNVEDIQNVLTFERWMWP